VDIFHLLEVEVYKAGFPKPLLGERVIQIQGNTSIDMTPSD
jgi:hypothetical protein